MLRQPVFCGSLFPKFFSDFIYDQYYSYNKTDPENNPCVSCGACCAYFRVSFYWAESESGGGTVPQDLTEQITPFMSAMKGTNQKHNTRCTALTGTVGECVSCAIYSQRPTLAANSSNHGLMAFIMKLVTELERLMVCPS